MLLSYSSVLSIRFQFRYSSSAPQIALVVNVHDFKRSRLSSTIMYLSSTVVWVDAYIFHFLSYMVSICLSITVVYNASKASGYLR